MQKEEKQRKAVEYAELMIIGQKSIIYVSLNKSMKMDLQSRKLEFIKEFLKVQSEEVVERLENLLKREQFESIVETDSMNEEELNKRIAQSENDFNNNRFKTSHELLVKYK